MSKYIHLILLIFSFAICSQAADADLSIEQSRYRVHPGDVLRVSYRYTPEYNASVEVQPDGYGVLQLLGEVKLGGLTVSEIREQLLAKASERLNNPEISVDLIGFEQPSVIVGGEVGTPGKYQLHGRTTTLAAIEMAGGFRDSAKSSQVLLIRPVDHTMAETRLIDLKKVLNKRNPSEDLEVKPGDMLIVPKTRFAKVTPYLRWVSPGAYGIYLNPSNF